MDGEQPRSSSEQASSKRVGRPRRLSSEEVVIAAIELADDQGLDGLSMPKLAKRLGVGTMTLYGYVSSKDDLLDKIAERIFDGLTISRRADWEDAMFEFFVDFRSAALAHPSLAQLLATGRVTIPAVFDILEATFRTMTDDGLEIEAAVRTFYAALTYTIGFVLWEIPRAHSQSPADYAEQWTDLVGRLDAELYPVLTGSAVSVAHTVASAEQYHWGLKRILTK